MAGDDTFRSGHVDYSIIIELTRLLAGRLEGLIIRYDPTHTNVLI